MKINLIVPSFYPAVIYGGPIFSVLYTCQELAKLNTVEVNVSTTNTNMYERLSVKTNENIKFENNLYVKYYNETKVDKFSLQLYLNVWKDIKNADIVHIQSIFNTPTPISLFYAKLFKKPILLSPRGSLGSWCIDNGSRFKSIWLHYFIKPFVKNITWHATAEQEKQEILMLFPDAKVKVIPNGINYEKFQECNVMSPKFFLKKFTNKDVEADKIIISMGRLQKKKGFDILINAFSKVLNYFSKSVLCIAGPDEGEEKNLNQLIQELNLIDKVFLVGSIEGQNKVDFLANADLFVLPSHNENFGNVYLESLASGTPIIASKNTPWSQVIEYKCGDWVENSKESTANAMMNMLQKNRQEMRQNAKTLAEKYSWSSIAKQFYTVFKTMEQNEK